MELRMGDEPEAPDLLVEGMERGTIVALCADTGGAKSFTAQDLVVAVAEGRGEWLGKKLMPRHGHAVIIDEENPERILRARLRALGLSVEGEPYVRCFHRIGVRFGAEGSDWTEWLHWELEKQPADVVVIDTGIAATAPEVNDNDGVARLYTDHLRPLATTTETVITLLLHEKKPQEGARIKQTFATMGARAWIQQADTQLMLAKRGRSEEEAIEDGGFRLESRFVISTGKLRDGGAEVIESLRISSRLRDDRALLEAEITNEGEVDAADPKVAQMLDDIVGELVEQAEPIKKNALAERRGVKTNDRTFERALEAGLESGRSNARSAVSTRSENAPMGDLSATVPPRFRHLAGFPRNPPIGVPGGGSSSASFRQVSANPPQPTAGGAYGAPPCGGRSPCRSLRRGRVPLDSARTRRVLCRYIPPADLAGRCSRCWGWPR